MADLDLKLEKKAADSTLKVRKLEGESNQQITLLDSKTHGMITDTKHSLDSVRLKEETERERLESRVMQNQDKSLAVRDSRMVSLI